jgi:hypothetical protein
MSSPDFSARCAALLLWFAVLSTASAFQVDNATGGGWVKMYGAGGYRIAAGPTSWPQPELIVAGAREWIWTRATTLSQALLYPDTRSSIASCYYSDTNFTVTVQFSDRNPHQVAFYFLDWDVNGRVQRVERLDPAGNVLESTDLRAFERGVYLVFNATGELRLRITRLTGVNAVFSGVFLDGPLNDASLPLPPVLEPNGGTFVGGVTVTMSAPSAESHVYFSANGSDPAFNGIPYTDPIQVTESLTIRAVTRNAHGQSSEVSATYTILPTDTTAEFLGADSTTLGNWKGKYGTYGYFMPYFAPVFPNHFWIDHSGTARWSWSWPATGASALQMPSSQSGTDRYAVCWYSPASMTFGFRFSDEREHIVSLYCIDWDRAGRIQRIELWDPLSGDVLDTQTISNFSSGIYLRWRISKDVMARVVPLQGPNAVISGIFLDPPYLDQVQAPVISPNGGSFADQAEVTISSLTAGAKIRYTTDGSTPTQTSMLYSGPITIWNSATLNAIAFKAGMQPSIVQSAYFNISSSENPTVARFLGEDRVTHGAWLSSMRYGRSGFIVVGDWTLWTNNSSFSFIGGTQHVWAFNRTEPSALEKYSSAGRIAACQYNAQTLTLPLTFNGNSPRRLTLYFLDWDTAQRGQRIEVIDAASSIVVDSRDLDNFQNGVYLTWEVTASVAFRITRLRGANAVVSGVFMD